MGGSSSDAAVWVCVCVLVRDQAEQEQSLLFTDVEKLTESADSSFAIF